MIVAAIATGVIALANWWSRWKSLDRLELLSKPLTTVGVIVVAALADGPRGPTIATVVALALCLIGDIALLAAVDRFVVGLAAFLLGHVAFIVTFVMRGLDSWSAAGVAIVGCAVLLGTVAMPIVHGAAAKGFGAPVRTYLVVITSMCVVGWATGNWLIALGAARVHRQRHDPRLGTVRQGASVDAPCDHGHVPRRHRLVGCQPGDLTAEHLQPLLRRGRLEHVVAAADRFHRGTRGLRVPMAGVDDGVRRHRCQPLQAGVHLLGVAAGEVGAAAPVEEQRVATDQSTGDVEALAPRGVARRVHQRHIDRADSDDIAGIVHCEVICTDTGGALHPRDLGALHVYRAVDTFEQGGDSFDGVAHHRAADVVGVVMGGKHADHTHVVGGNRIDQVAGGVRRVDEQALARCPVTDDVGEVDHLLGDRVAEREVATGQKLPEVEAVVSVDHCHRSYASEP